MKRFRRAFTVQAGVWRVKPWTPIYILYRTPWSNSGMFELHFSAQVTPAGGAMRNRKLIACLPLLYHPAAGVDILFTVRKLLIMADIY